MPVTAQVDTSAPPDVAEVESGAQATTAPPASRTTWEVIQMGGGKVGFSHTTRREIREGTRPVHELSSTSEITLQRFGEEANQQLQVMSVEQPDGRLLRFTSEIRGGTSSVQTQGRVHGDTLFIETTTQGKRSQTELPWRETDRSFFAVEQSLWQHMMQPGERRQLRMLLPVFYQMVEVDLIAGEDEDVELLDGPRRLLRVTNRTTLAANQLLETIMWVDRAGEIWKTRLPAIGQETYRTTEAIAKNSPLQTSYDLGQHSLVRLARPLTSPHTARQITYDVELRDGDPASQFVDDLSQSVRWSEPHHIQLTVRAVRPDQPPAEAPPGQRFAPDDLASNNLVQSDDPRVRSMAAQVMPEESNPWPLAVALENHVHHAIRKKDFSQAMATAAEVAESLQGDCTEHAVLLAALCRARGIPARAAIGLVYFAPEQGFAYHMWNEVWIKDRWIPLDATLGLGGIGAGHLKLAVSNLGGAAAYGAFLPVFQVLGRLKISVVDTGE
jgi:transglutaminase-like putative cysteine protease